MLTANYKKADEIKNGQSHCFDYQITNESIEQFAQLSGDFNPLHTDKKYAKSIGFSGCVAHGVFQQALVSQAVGMWLIGTKCLIASMESSYEKPLIYPADVKVKSEVIKWSPNNATGQVRVDIWDSNEMSRYSTTTLQISFHGDAKSENEIVAEKLPESVKAGEKSKSNRPLLVITGASGGIMQAIENQLADDFDLILVGRNCEVLKGIADRLSSKAVVDIVDADLLEPTSKLFDSLDEVRLGKPISGIIHAASFLPSSEPVHQWAKEQFSKEIHLSSYIPMQLGAWLKTAGADTGAKLILMGSNYAIHNDPETKLLRYGLSKSYMAYTAKALAHELAASKITVNCVSPDYVPYGMNAGTHPRLLRMKELSNPMKRLCQPEDIYSAINYLLSDSSGFISGEEIVLRGAKL